MALHSLVELQCGQHQGHRGSRTYERPIHQESGVDGGTPGTCKHLQQQTSVDIKKHITVKFSSRDF